MQFKFVSDLQQVGGFLQVFRFPSTNKTDHHDITEILTFHSSLIVQSYARQLNIFTNCTKALVTYAVLKKNSLNADWLDKNMDPTPFHPVKA
jgi:hypothetical protein